MKFSLDDKDVKYDEDDKEDNDVDNDNEDEYNDINEHLVNIDCVKIYQSNEVNVNEPDF